MKIQKSFSFSRVLEFGYLSWKKVAPWFVGIMLTIGVMNGLQAFINNAFQDNKTLVFIVSLIVALVGLVLDMAMVRLGIDAVEKKKIRLDTLLSQYKHIITYFAFMLLYIIIVLLGCVFLIVPGVIFAVMFGYGPALIVDKKVGLFEAFKLSAKITSGIRWSIFLYSILAIAMNIFIPIVLAVVFSIILGFSPVTFLVWIALTLASEVFIVPITMVGKYKIYKELEAQTK